jgi:hypothetical protein
MNSNMNKRIRIIAGLAVAAAASWGMPGVAEAQEPPDQKLTTAAPHRAGLPQLTPSGGRVHIMPTVNGAAALAKAFADTGPLLYHGGPIMRNPTLYAIFWEPPALQNGAPTSIPLHYAQVNIFLVADYPFHGIDNNNTQYFQTAGTTKTFILNAGSLGGFVFDTSPYPASGCTDSLTPGNCITDAQIQAEIQKVMRSKGWTGGLNNQFLLFTSKGEGSCFDSSSTSCAYVGQNGYCAYHGSTPTSPPIIYSNMPFSELSVCQNLGQPSPNGDPVADAETSVATHEITESITDPLVNVNSAWFTARGNEIGDLCNFNYGTNTWTSMVANDANHLWNGRFYEVQQEFDNHASRCVQLGP